MSISEKKKASNKRWNDAHMAERYDRIQLVVPKGRKDTIATFAKSQPEGNTNALINKLLREKMGMTETEWKSTTDSQASDD